MCNIPPERGWVGGREEKRSFGVAIVDTKYKTVPALIGKSAQKRRTRLSTLNPEKKGEWNNEALG